MAWTEGYHLPKKNTKPGLDDIFAITGKLDPEQARMWFAKFCKYNLSFATELLIGVKLAPIQELKLRSFFLRDFILDIEGRGSGKSFVVSIFIILYAIFNPGCKIGICSGTFRQSRLIFKQIEDFMSKPEGALLRQCINGRISHSTDLYEMKIGRSTIRAVPLTDKIRGLRFNMVILDELLLIPSKLIDDVILPFLSASQDGMSNHELYEAETKLIKAGKLKESDRTSFPANKVVGLSSASYKFEDLYKKYYSRYLVRIQDPDAVGVNHCLIKLSYKAAPPGLMNLQLIEEARSSNSESTFNREYEAIFTDDGSGYYKMEKILEATVPLDQEPKQKTTGDPKKKYLLSIDPNFSESETSDHFAMAVLEIDELNESGTLVHAFAVPGGKLSDKSLYLKYLLDNFNIVYIIIDNAGSAFLSHAQEYLGAEFPKILTELPDTFLDGPEGILEAKRNFNSVVGIPLHKQVFGRYDWIRLSNEHLQSAIQHHRIMFGSPVKNDSDRERAKQGNIPIDRLKFSNLPPAKSTDDKLEDFLDNIELIVELTKRELALIELKVNMSGHQTFDLPENLKITKDPKRARKDSYTALLLAAWGLKCYFDIFKTPQDTSEPFYPTWVA